MLIHSIHVGGPREFQYRDKPILTSIFKQQVDGPVRLGLNNFEGDEQSDLRFHGGRDKAVYAYSCDHYMWWQEQWGRPPEASQFGENLMIQGAVEQDVLIGSRYRCNDVELRVTQPRVPCYKLGIRAGDEGLTRYFWDQGRLGWYMRVEHAGVLTAGDALECTHHPDHGITVHELWRAVLEKDPRQCERALQHLEHLDSGWLRRLAAVVDAQS